MVSLAKIRYGNGNFDMIEFGSHVRCSVSKKLIPVLELSYWSVDLQEAYVDAYAAYSRYCENLNSKL